MVKIIEVIESEKKANIGRKILNDLPEWFGIEEATNEYIALSKEMPFFCAEENEQPIGFISLKKHNLYTYEIFAMGILKDFHHQGIGRSLIAACEDKCHKEKASMLTVKTLDKSRENKFYAKTRKFYLALGFIPLEVFPKLWGSENPCLFMVKCLECGISKKK